LANTKSARKMIRVSAHRRQRNAPARVAVKTEIKKANTAIAAKNSDAAESVVAAISILDQAAERGILHKNNAARRKSRLMRRLNAMSVAA
jgi:small subunit ribosomal protein S20